MESLDVDELKAKWLCYECIGEVYLRDEVQQHGQLDLCSYCGGRKKSYSIEDLAARIDQVFTQHYIRTSDQPNALERGLLSDREESYDWERRGESVVQAIANAAEIPDDAASDIQAVLDDEYGDFEAQKMGEETEYSSDAHYEARNASDHAWQEEWSAFEHSLKTEARFFSRTAAAHLVAIFGGIDKMSARDGRPLVIVAGPETRLTAIYRARVFQSDERLKQALCRPDLQLGPPPASLASAGRMNAHGISVFYGADEPDTAIAEVRPPVGSQVAVARFEILRPLRLLDLTALSAVSEQGSVFDPELAPRLERAMFLRSLSERITQPVMPDDEVFEHLPTQAIADFLATENAPLLDGIVFPSAQVSGSALNVVVFHKAARVEAMDIPHGTEVTADTGYWDAERWYVDYSVTEEVPAATVPDEKVRDAWHPSFGVTIGDTWTSSNSDDREVTLRIDLTSIKVHRMRRVQFNSDEHQVRRHVRRNVSRNSEVRNLQGRGVLALAAQARGRKLKIACSSMCGNCIMRGAQSCFFASAALRAELVST
jgi:RES domain